MPARQGAEDPYNPADFEMIDLERGGGGGPPPPSDQHAAAGGVHDAAAAAAGLHVLPTHPATNPPASTVRLSRWNGKIWEILLVIELAVFVALVIPAGLYGASYHF